MVTTYLVVLDELTAELATFTWTHHDPDPAGRVPAVVAMPRADWEQMGRPGSLDVEVRPTVEAPR